MSDLFEMTNPNRPNPVVVEMKRRSGLKQQVLDALKSEPRTSHELALICNRYSARIHELRKEGYDITKRKITESLFTYTLEGTK